MNKEQTVTFGQTSPTQGFNRLPVSQRASAAERKYAKAVSLYATTELSLREIADMCGVTPSGLSAHIGKYHRPLLYARYGLDSAADGSLSVKVKQPKGQSLKTHLKYKEAVEACGDLAYIEYNVSQVAHLFGLNGTALAAQLRVHYPDVIPNRERLRLRLGIADNTHRGARKSTVEAYNAALNVYRESDMTIPEVAEKCCISKSGFIQFLRFYHKDAIEEKASRRSNAEGYRSLNRAGRMSANGCLYGPRTETVELYAPALELYRNTRLTIVEIAARTGVPAEGFRAYVSQWHREDRDKRIPVRSAKTKYAPAIASLESSPRSISEVANEFGLNVDAFRNYLKKHAPGLAAPRSMKRRADGRQVKRSSCEKYAAAVSEYATTTETLKSIAARHGLVYKSLTGFVNRNCRAEKESHIRLVESETMPAKKDN